MSKIFETSEDLSNIGQSKFVETGLSEVGVRLKVLSLTKSNVAAKVQKANATTNFISHGQIDLVLYLYEDVLYRLDEDTRGRLIEGALSNASYDTEKDKLNIDTNPFGEVIRMSKKYHNYVNDLEAVSLAIEQIAEEAKERKIAEREAKKHQNHMSSGKVLDKILNEMYEELYKRATPHASFKQLLKNANWIDSSGNTVTSNNEHDEKWFKDNGYKKIYIIKIM